jgi:signal recognition particle receptor subunit beta
MVSLETESDRTLFFDLLPIEVGTIGGFKTRLQLYTVPGQVFYNTTRKLVLKGVDGLVFVADSQRPMREANIESYASLVDNLEELGLEMSELPLVMQYNKRDLKNILALEELNSDLNPDGAFPSYESSAINGDGVFETLKEITKLTLKKLRKRMTSPDGEEATTAVAGPSVRPVKPPQPAASISAAALARAAEEGVDEPPIEKFDTLAGVAADDLPSEAESEELGAPEASDDAPYDPDEVDFESKDDDAEGEDADEVHEEDTEEKIEDDEDAEIEVVDEPPAAEAELPPAEPEVADFQSGPFGDGPPNPDTDVRVEFDQTDSPSEGVEPPPLKHVHVSNQMDILAELDGLRKQATMGGAGRRFKSTTPDLDLDSLLSADEGRIRELRRRVEKALNSDVFKNMRGLQVAIRIQDEEGSTIHTLDPVSLDIDDATSLNKLCLRFSVDLENIP